LGAIYPVLPQSIVVCHFNLWQDSAVNRDDSEIHPGT
jgi:hypothetical protein